MIIVHFNESDGHEVLWGATGLAHSYFTHESRLPSYSLLLGYAELFLVHFFFYRMIAGILLHPGSCVYWVLNFDNVALSGGYMIGLRGYILSLLKIGSCSSSLNLQLLIHGS